MIMVARVGVMKQYLCSHSSVEVTDEGYTQELAD